MSQDSVRVGIEELFREFKRVLDKVGFSESNSTKCATIFTENTRDGVPSHGVNRFSAFIDFVQRGVIDLNAEPVLLHSAGAFERWDGERGAGPLNASRCMGRAIELAHQYSVGCVALRNTNHWMRGGTYGLQAAEAGCVGICWTNTTALMPPWGSVEPRLGNNPIVLCVPAKPEHVLLDMSMSQFSFGRLLITQRAGEKLPVPGGFDNNGAPTADPSAILESRRPLPIGYWKGSGMAMLLDCIVSLLAAGDTTQQITSRKDETGVCQVFIAIDLSKTASPDEIVQQIIADVHAAVPERAGESVCYPGERTSARRKLNSEKGVIVDKEIWASIKTL